MIAVPSSNVVRFTGFPEFLERVLADGFQEPVSSSAAGVFGDDERLVDD